MMHSMLFFFILLFVQVVAESLPVSSSTHVFLVQKIICLMGLGTIIPAYLCDGASQNGVKFETILHLMHLPTLVILAFFFRKRLFFLCMSWYRVRWIILKIICLTACADSMTVLFFIVFKLLPLPFPMGLGLSITAVILYSLRWKKTSHTLWNWRYALLLGTVQGIALLPGISRFAAVYASACWLGFSQRKAFEITWLIQTPLIIAACMHSIYLLCKADQIQFFIEPSVLFMTMIATICGLCAFYAAAYMARMGTLWWFSFYMIVPITVLVYLSFMM
jgi:undecaprenyl-diphosphatase